MTSSRLAQLVEQRTGVPRVVDSSPTPGTNTFLPNVTLLVVVVVVVVVVHVVVVVVVVVVV